MKTPGVYIEEVSTLPPSVAEVATAIPAFIGYTQKGTTGKEMVAEVNTLLEFEELFGGTEPTKFTATAQGVVNPAASNLPETPLWYAMNLYFRNGGGRCYVVSVGTFDDDHKSERYLAGLDALKAYDEPTLILMPGSVALTDYNTVCQAAIKHCKEMQDRFAILDARDTRKVTDDATAFRNDVGANDLMYAAAYYPYLKTTIAHVIDETDVDVGTGTEAKKLSSMKGTALYNQIKKQLGEQRVELPPSAAMAGIYAKTDGSRGVWKSPANVSIASVNGPTTQITHEQQELLNIDATSGKSINAIRAFSGKGVMVWGARTLNGNDNEWRYINVRRLFITVEESAKKSTAFAVFEANDSGTWLKVKGMLESYLYGLWEKGALQGAKPEQAFYVNVGLGKTMTPQDILEGRMKVEIGIAAVRPAEFIVLRFSHKLPEA